MPRISRIIIDDETAVYHVMSRTALPEYKFTDQEIKERYAGFYGEGRVFTDGLIPSLRAKLSSLSEFVREIKVGFARYYNKRHNRQGCFWGDRFKSVIVDKGETLIDCLAYIDLNPLRAGIVSRPEEYRWNSLGYHAQTNTRDNFLSTDFALKEFNVQSEKERIRKYLRYVYEAGAVNQPEKGKTKVIGDRILEKGFMRTGLYILKSLWSRVKTFLILWDSARVTRVPSARSMGRSLYFFH